MSHIIYFYSAGEKPFGVFSNFSRHPIFLDGERWLTTEHYFQAQKFVGHPEHVEAIQNADRPGVAAKRGRDRNRPLRRDWEEVKDDVMRMAVLAKFEQHEELRRILLSTQDAELVENAAHDYYWGCGKDGSGKNMLGIILMEVRAQLAADEMSQP